MCEGLRELGLFEYIIDSLSSSSSLYLPSQAKSTMMVKLLAETNTENCQTMAETLLTKFGEDIQLLAHNVVQQVSKGFRFVFQFSCS